MTAPLWHEEFRNVAIMYYHSLKTFVQKHCHFNNFWSKIVKFHCSPDSSKLYGVKTFFQNQPVLKVQRDSHFLYIPRYQLIYVYLVRCNFKKDNVQYVCKAQGFWLDVVNAWVVFNYTEPNTVKQILNQIVWCNSQIRVNNKPICVNSYANAGIGKIIDFLDENTGSFLQYEALMSKYPFKINYLQYQSMLDAIPNHWKKILKENKPALHIEIRTPLDVIMEAPHPARMVYNKLISNYAIISDIQLKCQNLGIIVTKDEVEFSLMTKPLTNITKYRAFHYRLLHNAIILNNRLYYYRLVDTQNCSFCANYKEDVKHFFYECKIVQSISKHICLEYHIDFQNVTFKDIFMNTISKAQNDCKNLIMIIVKQNLYAARCQKTKPNAHKIVQEIEFIKQMELNSAQSVKQMKLVKQKWNLVNLN